MEVGRPDAHQLQGDEQTPQVRLAVLRVLQVGDVLDQRKQDQGNVRDLNNPFTETFTVTSRKKEKRIYFSVRKI